MSKYHIVCNKSDREEVRTKLDKCGIKYEISGYFNNMLYFAIECTAEQAEMYERMI